MKILFVHIMLSVPFIVHCQAFEVISVDLENISGENHYNISDLQDERVQNATMLILKIETSDTTVINNALIQIKHVEELFIFSDSIRLFGEGLTDLHELKRLVIFCSQLESLPEKFGELTNLLGLEIETSKLTELPKSFSNLHQLDYLAVHQANFLVFPDEVLQLKNGLYYLHLDIPNITALPDNFSSLKFKLLDDQSTHGYMTLTNCVSLISLPPNIRSLNFRLFLKDAKSITDISSLNNGEQHFNLMITNMGSRRQVKKMLRSLKNSKNLSLIIDTECLLPFPRVLKKLDELEKLELLTNGNGLKPRQKACLTKRMPNTEIVFN